MSRTVADLEANAVNFWPSELTERENKSSILPKLIDTQEKFIGILYVADGSPLAWSDALTTTADMPINLFLKHLSVLADLGGEKFQRYRRNLHSIFPESKMTFRWRNVEHRYFFQSISEQSSWSNKSLGLDGIGLTRQDLLQPAQTDVAMLLLHGGSSIEPNVPDEIIEKCILGSFLGRKTELDFFVRQRYLHVSRITGGARSNAMGQLCQHYVSDYLKQALPDWDFSRSTIPQISQNSGRSDMSFDIVARSPSLHFCAIEISFQVTTNSTIERKAGQAQSRQALLHSAGHRIAYVIDGAGNFQRVSALRTICNHSDCTVTFQGAELQRLVAFLQTSESTSVAPRRTRRVPRER